MPDLPQDTRTKAGDRFGGKDVSFPASDKTTPTVVSKYTARQMVVPAAIGASTPVASTLPGFGAAHPDATNFPNCWLVELKTSPGDKTDMTVREEWHTLPGTVLTSKKTTQYGPVTVTRQPNKHGAGYSVTGATLDAAANASNAIEDEVDITTYDNMPGLWLYSYPVDPETGIGTRVAKRVNVNSTQGGIAGPGNAQIAFATVSNPTVITMAGPVPVLGGIALHLVNGEQILISGDTNTTPSINGVWPVTVIDSTHFSIPVHVTAINSSGYGVAGQVAPIYKEIQEDNDRQCLEIWSQIDTSTLAGAARTWSDYIEYPWKEVLLGLDAFTDSGVGTTTNSGGWPVPTTITWHFSSNTDVQVGIRTARYTGKTLATMTRSYSIGAPTPDAVLQIRTSSGEIVMQGSSSEEHDALSVATSSTGLQQSLSNAVHFKTARIEDVLTNGFVTGTTIGAGITLKMNASIPSTFTAASTFIGACEVTPGRLGLFMKETVTITVPSPYP